MRDLTAPRYVWITYGWYQEEWWRESKNSVCSNNQLAGIVERGLALQLFPRSRHPEVMTDTGLVGVDYVILLPFYIPLYKLVCIPVCMLNHFATIFANLW